MRSRQTTPLATAVLLVGYLSSTPVTAPGSLGSFELSTPQVRQALVEPTSCTGGDRQLFLGADLKDEKSGMVIRLVVNPLEGPAVRAFAAAKPFEESLVFHRSDCRTFHFSLESTALRINRIQDYRFSLELDCAVGDATLRGTALAAHCH